MPSNEIAVLTPSTVLSNNADGLQPFAPAERIQPAPSGLFTALAHAQAQFVPVAKTKTAKIRSDKGEFAYKYADLADILAMALPVLARNGLSVTQPIRRVGNMTLLVTEIHHSSGEVLADDGLPLPTGGSPQAFGSGLTYMRRYGFTSLVGIQADADEDGQIAKAEQEEQAELVKARRRTPAPAASPEPEAKWNEEQVAHFDATRKKAGWKKDATLAYVRHFLGVPSGNPRGAMAAQYTAAIEWASHGPEDTAAAAPKEEAAAGQAKITHQAKTIFWETARRHGKSDAAIGRYLDGVLGIKTTADMLQSNLAAALKWAASSENAGPEPSDEEKRARQGMGILGLDLNQQAELIDAHKQDWASIADAVSMEIARMDENSL